jgi:mercuric ion transport protein
MRKENIAGAGTIVAAFLAASCCIGPAVFIVFGVSVGFLGKLAFLEAYSPWFIGTAALLLGYSFYKLYFRPVQCACEEDFRARRISRVIFWIGTASLVFALTFRKVLVFLAG